MATIKTLDCNVPDPFAMVLTRLPEARPVNPSQTEWVAPCPAHEDTRPSLAITAGRDGRALVHCYAGCPPEAVVAALGLTLADLMPRKERSGCRPASASGRPMRPVRPNLPADLAKSPANSPIYPTVAEAVGELERRYGPLDALWSYHDATDEPVGAIVRWDHPADGNGSAGKIIRPVSRCEGGWTLAGMPTPRPLYRLPELLARPDERVCITEGEKAAEAGRPLGLLTTTSPHGSGSAARADWSPLAGRDVAILPDYDEAGGKYARTVADLLHRLDPPATVRIVHLPDLPAGGDLHDWVEARDAVESEALRRQLDALIEATAPLPAPDRRPATSNDSHPASDERRATNHPPLRPGVPCDEPGLEILPLCLADIEQTEIRWLWPGRVPRGRITVLVGRPGEGKSFLTTDMAARITTGRSWPDGTVTPAGSVLLICAEDDPADTIRPRLATQGADLTRVHLLTTVRRTDADGNAEEALFRLTDRAALEAMLRTLPDCRLIVVDPIGSFLGGRTDAHRDNDVRSVLAPVAKLAEQYGPAVLVVAHRRKSGGTNADDLALGSRAFTGIARSVWHLSRDPQDKARRLLLPGKNNLAPEGSGLAFTITGHPPTIRWEADPVAMTANEALAAEVAEAARKPGPPAETREAAAQWLTDFLADGPKSAEQVRKTGETHGYPLRTIYRARDALGVRCTRDGMRNTRFWSLPTASATEANQ